MVQITRLREATPVDARSDDAEIDDLAWLGSRWTSRFNGCSADVGANVEMAWMRIGDERCMQFDDLLLGLCRHTVTIFGIHIEKQDLDDGKCNDVSNDGR